jgi:hypothetical protein
VWELAGGEKPPASENEEENEDLNPPTTRELQTT